MDPWEELVLLEEKVLKDKLETLDRPALLAPQEVLVGLVLLVPLVAQVLLGQVVQLEAREQLVLKVVQGEQVQFRVISLSLSEAIMYGIQSKNFEVHHEKVTEKRRTLIM